MTQTERYQQLKTEALTLADIGGAMALLGWDQEVMMPSGAAAGRAQQLSTLATIHQNRLINLFKPLLDGIDEGSDQLSSHQQQTVIALRRTTDKATKLPEAFVGKMAETTARAQHTWEGARANNRFQDFAPVLSEIIDLKRQEAAYYGYKDSPYDALLDTYDPGLTTRQVTDLFEALKPRLQVLIAKVAAAKQVDDSFLLQHVPADAQFGYTLELLRQLGYDFDMGRQDRSSHPFSTTLGPSDVRVTTRVDEQDALMAISSTIHECGHALYEQGLDANEFGLPKGEACSLSIHESQSRIWENNVGRGRAFWQSQLEQFQALYPDQLQGTTPEALYKAVNKVQPSLIRIAADELTYHFHILLRFELERDLIKNKLQVADLPAAWANKVQQYLGIEVTDDANGVLQDIHWSHGSFGYFPTYSLGSFYAAQFYHYSLKAIPNLEAEIAQRNYSLLHNWLKANVYVHGRLYTSDELCKLATGEVLRVDYFMDYITAKLTDVYDLR